MDIDDLGLVLAAIGMATGLMFPLKRLAWLKDRPALAVGVGLGLAVAAFVLGRLVR